MALCERCRAEIESPGEPLPPPWFDGDCHTVAGEPLTPKEWQVLEILWRRRDRPVTSETLMTLLYSDQPDDPPQDKIIQVYICRLRAKLDRTPYSIRSTWGDGYQLLDHKQRTEIEIGEAEDDKPPPRAAPRGGDKYRLTDLKPGQSRRIVGARLESLRYVCSYARRHGRGSFDAGYDEAGHMRIWRLE